MSSAFAYRLLAYLVGTMPLLTACAPALERMEPPLRSTFDAALITKGAQLAAIGNCKDCHTAPEGKAYAGGMPIQTQFGTIYGTNITPDTDTGIGRWSEAAFRRAMHEGLDREGRHLYPVFPYDHLTKTTDEDAAALYAFVMTRDPVRAVTPPNRVSFPFNLRPLIGAWKRLYFERGRFVADSAQSAEWNRGAYLVEGLGHCGACHTPRNLLGAEKKDQRLSGGEADKWDAPALNAASPAPVPWTAEQLYHYLRYGYEDVHDAAAGPMAPVTHNLATVAEQDVRAIAIYIASFMSEPTLARRQMADARIAQSKNVQTLNAADRPGSRGAEVYAGACALCHDHGRKPGTLDGALQLTLSTSVANPTPRNLIRIIVEGITPRDGERGRWMPSFAGALTTDQITDLVIYLRANMGKAPAWRNVDAEVQTIMQSRKQP